MSTESAIVEENDVQTDEIEDTPQPDPVADDYTIEEPDDDEEFKVPVIDTLDEDDDETIPSADNKNQTPPKASEKKEADTGKGKDAAQKPQDALPEALVAKAKKLGIYDEDIAVFSKPEQLERLCGLIEPAAAEAVKPQEKPAESKPEADEGDFKVELDPAIYEPGIREAMKSTADQINGIKKALSDIVGAVRQQSEASFEKNFEAMIAGLGDEFSDTLGKGSLDEIGTDSEFFKNRCKLVDEMNAVAAGYAQTGKTVPSPKQLFQRAVNSVFGDTIKANTRKEIASQLEKRAGQIISRPTGKKGKDSQTPEQRATTAVKEKLREFGADVETDIQDDF